MNTTDINDDQILARLRGALDEVTAHSGDSAMVPLRSNPTRSHALRWVAAAAAVVALIGAIAWTVGRDNGAVDVADSTVGPPTSDTTPPTTPATVPADPQMRYFLSTADLVPETPGTTTIDSEGDVLMAWALGADPAAGLLTLQASATTDDVDPADTYTRVVDGTNLYFSGHGIEPDEFRRIADSVVAGSGLPWVLPEPGWEVLAVGEPTGTSVIRRYSNAVGMVTLGESPYNGEWSVMATADSITGVEVAGQLGWMATNTNGEFTMVMWRLPDEINWATMYIESTFADRAAGLIAAVVDTMTAEPAQPVDPPAQAGWLLVPGNPLTPRSNALGVWTGSEALLFGGIPMAGCPPNADCGSPGFAELRDGAAFDPATGAWRSLTSAPFPVSGGASSMVVDESVYVLANRTGYVDGEGGFARYNVATDAWTGLSLPPGDRLYWRLTAAGDTVAAFAGSDEQGAVTDWIFDAATDSWTALPDDPLGPSFDRMIASVGNHLYLFARDLVPDPNSEVPSLMRVARLDLRTSQWELLADSDVIGGSNPLVVGELIVFPTTGSADGGQVNNWGRSYPYGGIYDTATDTWSALPDPAADGGFVGAGAIDAGGGAYGSAQGGVLDVQTGQWIEIPVLTYDDSTDVLGQTIVSMGRTLLVFGGEWWGNDGGHVISDTLAWTP
jgi:hypothetical protein